MRNANNTYKENKFNFTKDEKFVDVLGTIVKGSSVHFPENRNHNMMVSFSIDPTIFARITTPMIIPTFSCKDNNYNKAPNWGLLKILFKTTSWKKVCKLYETNDMPKEKYDAILNSDSFGLVGSDDNNQLMTLDIDSEAHAHGTKIGSALVKELQSNLFNGDHPMIYNYTQSGGLHVYMTSKLLHGSSTKTVSYLNDNTKTKFDMDIKSNDSYVVLKGEDYGRINIYVRFNYFIDRAKKMLTNSDLFGQDIADAYKDFFSPIKDKNDFANVNQFKFDAFTDESKIYFLLVIAYMNRVNIFNYQSVDPNFGDHKLIANYPLADRRKKIIEKENKNLGIFTYQDILKNQAREYRKLRQTNLQSSPVVQDYLNRAHELKEFMKEKNMIEQTNLTREQRKALTRSNRTKAHTSNAVIRAMDQLIIQTSGDPAPSKVIGVMGQDIHDRKYILGEMDNDEINKTNKPKSTKLDVEKNTYHIKHDDITPFDFDVAKAVIKRHNLTHFTDDYCKGVRNDSLLDFASYLRFYNNWSYDRILNLLVKLDSASKGGLIQQNGKSGYSEIRGVVNNVFKDAKYRVQEKRLRSVLGFDPFEKSEKAHKNEKGEMIDRNGHLYRTQQSIFTNTNKHYNVICDGIVRAFKWAAEPPIKGMSNLTNYYQNDYSVNMSYAKLARLVNKKIMCNYKRPVTAGSLKNVMHLLFKPISHFNVYDKIRWFELKLRDKKHTDEDFKYNSDTFAKFQQYIDNAHKIMTDAEIQAKSYRFNEMLQNYGKAFLGYVVSPTILEMLSLKIDHIGVGRNSLHRFEMHLETLDFNKDYNEMLAKEKQSNSLFARINASKLAYKAFLANIKSISVVYDKANSEDNLHNQDSTADAKIGGLFTYAQQTILNNQAAQSANQIIQNNLLKFDKISQFIQAKPRNGP